MQILKKIPFFLLFLVVFFCLHGWVENYGSISSKEIALIGLSISLTIFIFLFNRNYILSSLIAFYLAVWYLFFGAIQDAIKSINVFAFLGKYSVLLPLIFISLFLFIWLLKKNKQSWYKLVLFLNALFIIYTVYDSIAMIAVSSKNGTKQIDLALDYSKIIQKPNVYYLLFDGYPGTKELIDSFNFDNRQFNDFLTTNEFKSLPIRANYDMTQYSMSSILNLTYINPTLSLEAPSQKELQKRQDEIKNALIFDVFEKMGYELKNNSIFDIHDLPGISNQNNFLLSHGMLLTDKIFINRLDRDLGLSVPIKYLKYFPFLQNKSMYRHRTDNIKAEKTLLKIVDGVKSLPVFNYTHFLMPHEPFYFDSLGTQRNLINEKDRSYQQEKDDFVSYLKYCNKLIEKLALYIKKKDTNSIIIIMSDHGLRSVKGHIYDKSTRLNNIAVIYFPNKMYGNFPDSITNVNFFRYLLNTQFSQQLPYLKDSTFQ